MTAIADPDKLLAKAENYPHEGQAPRVALLAVIQLAINLQDDDPWHEDAAWNAGYNYAMYKVYKAIKKELL